MRILSLFIFLILLFEPSIAGGVYLYGGNSEELVSVNDVLHFQYDAYSDGYFIESVEITVPNDPTNITILFGGAGNTITITISTDPFASYEKYDVNVYLNNYLIANHTIQNWLGNVFTDTIRVRVSGIGIDFNGFIVSDDSLIDVIEKDPPRTIEVTSSRLADIKVYGLQDSSYFQKPETSDPLTTAQEYANTMMEIISTSLILITAVFYYFKLILIDNGIIVFGVWESLVLLYASYTSRDIVSFFRRVVRTHREFVEFVIQVIYLLVQIFTSVIRAIGSLIPFT